MFSSRQFVRELQRLRQDVDAVGERVGKYEENIERLDKCVERLENVISRWEGTRSAAGQETPPIGELLSVISSLSGKGGAGSLGPMVTRLVDVVSPIVALARTLQDSPPGSLRPDITKVSKEGVASVVLLGLMVSAMEDKLREGVESIVEVAKPYRGLAETQLMLSRPTYGAAAATAGPGALPETSAGTKPSDIISLATSIR